MSEGHDTTPVHTTGIFYFILALLGTLALLLAALWYFQAWLAGPARAGQVAAEPESLPQPLQPSPGHPATPRQDLAALRTRQETILHSAGTLPDGRRHIPIQQAIDQLLNSGVLTQPWKNPETQPFTRPPDEPRLKPSVENRT